MELSSPGHRYGLTWPCLTYYFEVTLRVSFARHPVEAEEDLEAKIVTACGNVQKTTGESKKVRQNMLAMKSVPATSNSSYKLTENNKIKNAKRNVQPIKIREN